MSELDLDSSHYDIDDLERFFKLSKPYNANSIIKREHDLRTLLLSSGHIDKFFKRDLIAFLEEGKSRLLETIEPPKAHTTIHTLEKKPVPDHFPIPNIPYPSREENIILPKATQFVYTQESEHFPGTLNPLDRRTIQKCLSIDTRFRPPMSVHSDFTFTLPSKIPKVLSMECSSFEMDTHGLYNISAPLQNNYIYIAIKAVDQEYNRVFVVPDGNYTVEQLLETLNRMLGDQAETPFLLLQWKLDPYGSRKCILMVREDQDYYTQRIESIVLDFTLDKNGNQDSKNDTFSKMGYVLGFTRKVYVDKTQYMSDVPVRMYASIPYFYLVVDDFQNRASASFPPAFSQMTMNPSILARLTRKENGEIQIVSNTRNYFGPIDLARMHIQLVDVYGNYLRMDSNYSFCLVLNTVYDL